MKQLKRIDCHRHISNDIRDLSSIEEISKKMNINKIVIFGGNGLGDSGFDQRVWDLYEQKKHLIYPFCCEFKYVESDIEYVRACLEKGFYGLGEILIGHTGANRKSFPNLQYDNPIPVEIFKIAGEKRAPVLIHCDEAWREGFLRTLSLCPNTNFIWAHMGYDFSQGLEGEMRLASELKYYLETYSNLYFDISFWEKSALCMDSEEYIKLFEEFPTRFMWGMDMTDNYDVNQIRYSHSHELVLKKASQDIQTHIYYDNFERLMDNRKQYYL